MPENASRITNPSCSGLPTVSIGIGGAVLAFEFNSSTKIKGIINPLDRKLYFNNVVDIYNKNYITGSSKTISKNELVEKNNFYGFNIAIPEYNVNLPSFTIPGWPSINLGCNECESDEFPPLCGWESKSKRFCKRILGKKICVTFEYFQPTKCFNEPVLIQKTLPSVNLFNFQRTELEFSFQLIPDIEIDTTLILGNSFGVSVAVGSDPNIDAFTRFVNLQIKKLKFGMKMRIKKLHFSYGSKGFNIENLIIPLILPIDIFSGQKLLNIVADANGNLSVWYLIRSFSFSVYDILNVIINASDNTGESPSIDGGSPLFGSNLLQRIINNVGQIVVNFLKTTIVDINMGLLVCPMPNPKEDVFLSFVISTAITSYPFRDLNRIEIPKIPEQYTKIPKIPDNEFLPDEERELINSINQKALEPITSFAAKEIVNVTKFIKETLENISITAKLEIPVPLILKTVPIIPVA
jgi:hypothetical protein